MDLTCNGWSSAFRCIRTLLLSSSSCACRLRESGEPSTGLLEGATPAVELGKDHRAEQSSERYHKPMGEEKGNRHQVGLFFGSSDRCNGEQLVSPRWCGIIRIDEIIATRDRRMLCLQSTEGPLHMMRVSKKKKRNMTSHRLYEPHQKGFRPHVRVPIIFFQASAPKPRAAAWKIPSREIIGFFGILRDSSSPLLKPFGRYGSHLQIDRKEQCPCQGLCRISLRNLEDQTAADKCQ